jgi:hypothetical protein
MHYEVQNHIDKSPTTFLNSWRGEHLYIQ